MFNLEDMRGRTYATVRAAFNSSKELYYENGRPGSCNISSILTKIVQDVGRFSESYSSDALYGVQHLRDLAEQSYHVEPGRDFDEIFLFGIRQSGVDHNDYVMRTLARNGDPLFKYVYPERSYRRILAVRARARYDEACRSDEVDFSLRDITHGFHRLDPADLTKEQTCDIIILPNFDRTNPEPEERYRVDLADIARIKSKGFDRFEIRKADPAKLAEDDLYGSDHNFSCAEVLGFWPDTIPEDQNKGVLICRCFKLVSADLVVWNDPLYRHFSQVMELVDRWKYTGSIGSSVSDAAGS